jgi:hypothetical protein
MFIGELFMKLIKENNKGKTFDAEDFKICYRVKDSVSGDNEINPKEIIYLITGSMQLTIENETKTISAPEKIMIPEKTYHKIKALTDISFIMFN